MANRLWRTAMEEAERLKESPVWELTRALLMAQARGVRWAAAQLGPIRNRLAARADELEALANRPHKDAPIDE